MNVPYSIALRDVTVAFIQEDGVRPVLQHIDLEIASGQFVAVLGSNGSGKSTLLRVAAGLLPVSRGTVERLDDSPIPIIFQNPDAQIVGETVIEDIRFGLENLAVPAEQMEERVSRALESVGLAGYEARAIDKLSGGQKQLVCVASAMAMQPSVLVMDEPTAMLDTTSKQRLIAIAKQWKREGKTVLWSTHMMDEVGLADRVIVLASGRIVFDGTAEDFFYGDDENDGGGVGSPCDRFGFRPPYAVELVRSLRRRGLLHDCKPVLVEDCMEAVSRLCR